MAARRGEAGASGRARSRRVRSANGDGRGDGGAFDGVGSDVRHGARALVHRPWSSLAAVVTVALGIGATTTVFAVVRSVLLRPLPFADSEALVVVRESHEGRERSASPAGYLDWRRSLRSFSDMASVRERVVHVQSADRPVRIAAAAVSGNFFRTLRVAPAVGRGFDPAPLFDGGVREVVLGHALWRARFGGDASLVGRPIRIDDASYVVVGVGPAGFSWPEGTELWIRSPFEAPSLGDLGAEMTAMRDAWFFDVIGRLASGVTLEAAQAEAASFSVAQAERFPETAPDRGLALTPLLEDAVAGGRTLLLLLMGAVGLVLLATCANVAGLALVRSVERSREMAVRAALGAGRWRNARLVLVQCLVLAVLGGAVGTLGSLALLSTVVRLLPDSVPRLAEIRPDAVVLLVGLTLSTLTGVAFGVLPAVRAASGASLHARGGSAGPGRPARILVAVEVALAVILVSSSLLLVRSLTSLTSVDPGFEPERLVNVRVSLPGIAAQDREEQEAVWRALERAVAEVPGVRSVALGSGDPTEVGPRARLRIESAVGVEEGPDVAWEPVGEAWFETLGMRLVAGRGFTISDGPGAPDVAVVNEMLVRNAFGRESPIGRRITIGLDGHDRPLTIVGVVASTRNRGPDAEPFPVLFRPITQVARLPETWTLAARTEGAADPADLVPLREAVSAERPDAVVFGLSLGVELGSSYLAERRFVLRILGAFGVLALLLGGLGVYGVAAGVVERRRREIGVRMAVGADRAGVVARLLGEGLVPVVTGLGAGMLGSMGAARLLGGMLYGVAPADPLTALAVSGILLVVALAALTAPALRAAAVDPAVVLRGD